MPDAVTIEIPENDIRELVRIQKLRAKYIGEDAKKTVRYTAYFVSKAAGAATRVAPKLRRIVKNPAYTPEGDQRRAMWAAKRYMKNGDIKLIPIKAATKEEARLSPRAKISRRGLARDQWKWILSAMGFRGGKTMTKKRMAFFHVEQLLQSGNPQIVLENRLPYAARAFKTKGRATVGNIVRRASNSMRKDLERRAKRTIAETNK